ncbi:MAG: SurA N-terminal domain-containing protein [Sediminicola sp.]|tara:strand:+ start:134040 stop:136160 length:2121 start_codon:yes stop_codon:yes gene_type:complete
MAILEKIRKRTTILILIIGLALFAFVISGVFSNNGFSDGKVGSSVAEVNGEEISIDEFRGKVEAASRRYGAQASTMQIVNNVYDQEIRSAVLGQQLEDLGIDIQQDQIVNYISTNPSYNQSPQFLNESGMFDPNKFRGFIADLKTNNPAQYQLWLQEEKAIVQMAKEQTYFNLIRAGVGATLKEGELEYKLTNDKVDLQYARVPYTSIPDSTITVSKKEIANYIDAHKKDFKQERARDIQYVYFEEKASLDDEKAIEGEIVKLLDDTVEYNDAKDMNDTLRGFRGTTEFAAFLERNSDTPYDTIYKAKNQLPAKFADTLMNLPVGGIYGPYRDGDFFKISRMVDKKANGSVKASHILISYTGAERATPEVTRTKEEAEKMAAEVLKEAKKEDVVFAELAREKSDGPSATNGGDLGYFQEGAMTEKFNDFAFNNPVGHVGLVETEFGYHIVKVDDKRDIYRIATLSREIEPSEQSTNDMFTNATKFEMETIDSDASFLELAKANDYVVRPVKKIKEMDENLPGLSAQRGIVQWAFNEDTKAGDIKRFNINNGYVIVQVTATYADGVMSPEDASAIVLPKLRKEKKAEMIMEANKGKSMEAFAKDNNVTLSTASAVNMKSPTIPGAGKEATVVGKAFSMEEGSTSGLIEGETGIFMVKVTKKVEAPKLDNYATYANTLRTANVAKVGSGVYNALKEEAEIEDNRALFY